KDSQDLSALPSDTPAVTRELLRRCLEKDPRRRLRDIGEARIQIEDCIAHPEPPTVPTASVRQQPLWPVAAVSVLALLLAIGAVYWERSRAAPERASTVFTIPPPAGSRYPNAAISPDGLR